MLIPIIITTAVIAFAVLVVRGTEESRERRKDRNKVKQFIKKCFLKFVESTNLPQYCKKQGKPLRWDFWTLKLNHKFDEFTGKKTSWYEAICLSVDNKELAMRSMSDNWYGCNSSHVYKISLNMEDYNDCINEALPDSVLIQKFKECTPYSGHINEWWGK